jgi:putative tricarboxylic transport membrane protein
VTTPTEDPADTAPKDTAPKDTAPKDTVLDGTDRPPAAGPLTNLLIAGTVVVLGGLAFAQSLRLGVGSASAPGPGTWPALVSGVLLILGIVLAARFRHTDDAERFGRTGLLVLAAVATMAMFVAVVATIGFEIPTALLAFVWLRFLGREGWRTSIAISLGATVSFYLLFVAALDVSIPHLF